jgi:RNA polymerase primary sigma factor
MSSWVEDGEDHGQLRRQAARRPVLTAAEEVCLAELVERGDRRAREEMIVRNLRLVFALARPYRGRGVSVDDLVQEGIVGLIRAVEKFDHRRGLKFSTYAVWWIRRSLHSAVGTARTIRIPVSAGRQLAAVQRAEGELRRRGAGSATDAAIANEAGLSLRTVTALRAAAQVTASLDQGADDDGTPLGDLIPDAAAPVAFEQTDRREAKRQVWKMLAALPMKHRDVIARRYGLLGSDVQGHDEIAAWLGVGEERSRQIEREALHWLRELGGGRERAALAG